MLNRKAIAYALSLAASWAWGVSLVVGMETVQTKGILPFAIWATANSLALPLFGLLAFGIPHLHDIVETKIVQVFTTSVMVFCLWIQMNAIYEKTQQLGFSAVVCKLFTIAIAIFLVIGLYKDGLLKNILLDKTLWCLCYVILLIMLCYAFFTGSERYSLTIYETKEDITWAVNTILILFAGPVMNIQNWQMARMLKEEGLLKKAHFLSGLFFGIYMLIVFMLAHYHFDTKLYIIQVVAILCITVTTMDAAIVGMQRIGGEKVGAVIAIVAILLWRFLIPMGVLNLWTFIGNRRKEVAGICIVAALIKYIYVDVIKKGKKVEPL